jgi:glucose 1-dehydrogenase
MTLNGKVAIVTGSSSGIGKAIAIALAAAGAAITIDYRSNRTAAEDTQEKITTAGGRAFVVQADVSKLPDLQNLVDETVQTHGRLDIMVNNAGIETRTSTLDTTEAEYDRVLNVNLKSAFFGTQFAARQMIAQGGGGRIINISSIHEDWPMPGNSPYCLSKGGMRMLARNAGVELAEHNITVVNVAPGAITTPINEQTMASSGLRDKLEAVIPLARMGTSDEVANLVAWLASDAASYSTATTFVIDGGMMQFSLGL